MDSLRGIISDLHVFLYGGIRTLPLTLAGTMVILGLFTANYAMMFFLVGFLIVIPFLSSALNALADTLVAAFGIDAFKTKTSDICNVVIPYATLSNSSTVGGANVLCTTSFAMICFFLGYIMTNAVSLYQQPPKDGADPAMISNRKSHVILGMASIALFSLIMIGFRINSGCEPSLGSIAGILVFVLGIVIFAGLGMGWYNILSVFTPSQPGLLADLFGISSRILPESATAVACVVDPTA